MEEQKPGACVSITLRFSATKAPLDRQIWGWFTHGWVEVVAWDSHRKTWIDALGHRRHGAPALWAENPSKQVFENILNSCIAELGVTEAANV